MSEPLDLIKVIVDADDPYTVTVSPEPERYPDDLKVEVATQPWFQKSPASINDEIGAAVVTVLDGMWKHDAGSPIERKQPTYPNLPPCVKITPVGPDGFDMLVEYIEPTGYVVDSTIVDLNPRPTWPSPAESRAAILDAVGRVWDAAHRYYTGEEA